MPDLKPELSSRSKYWIPKHRYYELKHYCLQYPEWKRLYSDLGLKLAAREGQEIHSTTAERPTEKWGIIRAECKKAMDLVMQTAKDASPELWLFIFTAVTEGVPFVRLQTLMDIPCGKDMYYDHYRKFFYLLSQRRGI